MAIEIKDDKYKDFTLVSEWLSIVALNTGTKNLMIY
jgi:hypothetical protein